MVTRFASRVSFPLVHLGSDLAEVLVMSVFESSNVMCCLVDDSPVNCLSVTIVNENPRQLDFTRPILAPNVASYVFSRSVTLMSQGN